MKALVTVLSMMLLAVSANVLAVEDRFRVGIHDDKIVIDLGKYSHKKAYSHKENRHKKYRHNKHGYHDDHHYNNRRYQHSSRCKPKDNYCVEHHVYHHHYSHPHSNGDYANHHHYVPGYYMNNHEPAVSHSISHCWPVKKKGYWKGRKALVGGKMCRDHSGYTYVVPESRYLIKYRGRYK